MKLFDYQLDAVRRMKNGCILCGGVGSGKSITALAYYYLRQGGLEKTLTGGPLTLLQNPKDLYIITTARKRDTKEWEGELEPFLLCPDSPWDTATPWDNVHAARVAEFDGWTITIDSWNNIQKYKDITGAFFLFDEQRVVGSGAWVKSFLKIAKGNEWILLSATPGDTWQDYIPVFIANGFYKNRTEFTREHIVYSRFTKYPKVDRYLNTGRLIRLRNHILVNMDFQRKTVSHHETVWTEYDAKLYKDVNRRRWDIWKDEPLTDAGGLCYALRRVVNTNPARVKALGDILEKHPRAIIFYNFDYELDILKYLALDGFEVAEWNGHKHQELPTSDKWVYLVQYNAGAEGWNCVTTDTVIFYSQTYSYKVLTQACGRIDRLNTPYTDLYYYHLKSRAPIDIAISRALAEKKNFNEGRFVNW